MNSNGALEEKFRTEGLFGREVVVGFSGGADSSALLHRLFSLREELSLSVRAVHINHCLRGEEADRDEAFARDFCRQLGIPFACYRINIAALAREKGLSIEECGREERYKAFAREAGKEGIIATAHTLSDSAETALLNLARGTGPKGLAGIPFSRGNILRPLIRCSREEVEDYCRRMGICYVTDSTNFSGNYSRNRIRQKVLPELLKLNPAFLRAFLRTSDLIREDEAYLSSQADRLFESAFTGKGLSLLALSGQPRALVGRVFARFLRENGLSVSSKNISLAFAILEKGAGRELLEKGVFLRAYRGVLVCETEKTIPYFELPLPFPLEGRAKLSLPQEVFPGRSVIFSVIDWENTEKNQKIYKKLLSFAVDYDTIIGKLLLRQRKSGDAISLPGRGRRTLKKLFSEKGLTALERQTALVLADEAGVLWAEGIGTDVRCQAGENTRRLLIGEEEISHRGPGYEKV